MRPFAQEEKAEICATYKQGATTRQLGTRYRCRISTIAAILDEAGIQRRPSNYHLVGRKLSAGTKAKISAALSRHLGPAWKGGITVYCGRRFVLNRDHPHAKKNGYVREHRLVMERILGWYLRPEEVVHHINGDRFDNRPRNLMLFANQSAHRKHHIERGDVTRNEVGQFEAKRI